MQACFLYISCEFLLILYLFIIDKIVCELIDVNIWNLQIILTRLNFITLSIKNYLGMISQRLI